MTFAKQQQLHVADRHAAIWASGERPLRELLRPMPPPREPTALLNRHCIRIEAGATRAHALRLARETRRRTRGPSLGRLHHPPLTMQQWLGWELPAEPLRRLLATQ
ncbi:hypothetical protein [Streptomyces sp. OV198]|uniref:hypothetical protein n=1 Tax=Streptomyces sp. OV198 TaxID=1882787 RepID=UPI0027B99451|nr:hypothetical protein [Streptomyces sp. OV198]